MWMEALLDLIFPPACEVCRGKCEEPLCPDCFSQIKLLQPQYDVYAAAPYDGVVKRSLHRFKFQKRKKLVRPLGIVLVKYIHSQNHVIKIEEMHGVVPVPLHLKRLRERGFNQVELLAEIINRYYEVPVVRALERTRNTRAQFDLPRAERIANVKGAFKVTDPKSVFNRNLLLLDDIYTTGATTAECAKALKIAGARRVEVLTLARAGEI